MFYRFSAYEQILEKLNGEKHLILGNHDEWVKKLTEEQKQKYFVDGIIYDSLMRKKNKIELHFCHYPMLDWNGSHYFGHSFSICGHIHQRKEGRLSAEVFPLIKNQFNAGVDINNYEPVTFEELIENNAEFYNRIYTEEEVALLKEAVEKLK